MENQKQEVNQELVEQMVQDALAKAQPKEEKETTGKKVKGWFKSNWGKIAIGAGCAIGGALLGGLAAGRFHRDDDDDRDYSDPIVTDYVDNED